jgi:phage-related protein
MRVQVDFYETSSGRSPVHEYLKELEKPERARILSVLSLIQEHGFDVAKIYARHLEGKLWELRISSHRLFYSFTGKDQVMLLHAYKKQGQKIPLHEREVAMQRMKEILR